MERKDVFFDKRDSQYIQLHSSLHFYEMFVRKKIKSDVLIPQTVIFTKGTPSIWLFNSSKAKTPLILKKNSDKLNLTEVGRVLCKVRNTDDYRIDSLTTLLEVAKGHDDSYPVAFVRYAGDLRKGYSKTAFVKALLESKDKVISNVQEFVPNSSIIAKQTSDETYYVEYRQDDANLPVGYRFFKKTLTVKPVRSRRKLEDNNPFHELIDVERPTPRVNLQFQAEQVPALFKFFDSNMNGHFSEVCKRLVEFLEKAYRIKVKKMVAKFLSCHQVYFLGLKELMIEIPSQAPYDGRIREELRDPSNCAFTNFQVLCKVYLKRGPGKKAFKLPQTIFEDDKEISAKLYKNLIVEHCCGDFCDYIMIEKNRGPLAIRKNILDDYKKHFGDAKTSEENFSVTLPFEISFQLILRTRECSNEVIEIMKEKKIFSKYSDRTLQNDDPAYELDLDREFPFKNKKTEVYNMGNLYKNVKICKNCFIVYSLTSKYFDQRLKGDLKHKDWRASTAATTSRAHLETAPTTMQVNETLHTIEEAPERQPTRIVKSASQETKFKIKKRVEPKLYKLYMPPKQRPMTSAAAPPQQALQSTQKHVDMIRLTMGFLNYDRRPKTQQVETRQPVAPKPQQIIRKAFQQEESKAQQEFQHEKLILRKGCQNESDMRHRLKDYYETKARMYPVILLDSGSVYSYHSNLQSLRTVPTITMSQPDLKSICRQTQTPYPPMSIPDHQLSHIEYFQVDDQTAVPFLTLMSGTMAQRVKTTATTPTPKEETVFTQGPIQVVVFVADLFDSCFEYLSMWDEIIQQSDNTVLLMLNLPGQAYSLFDETRVYDNLTHCELIDRLLCDLDEKRIISTKSDTFKFVGIGLGGFVLQTLCCFAVSNMPFIQGILLINSFAQVDEMFSDTLRKSMEVFLTCPPDMADLAYNYYSVVANSRQLTEQEVRAKMAMNPITLPGRLSIITGCLNSAPTIQSFTSLPLQVEIVHSLKNCIVNLSQTDQLMVFQSDTSKDTGSKLVVKRTSKQSSSRHSRFIDGGHSLIDENPGLLKQLMQEFVS